MELLFMLSLNSNLWACQIQHLISFCEFFFSCFLTIMIKLSLLHLLLLIFWLLRQSSMLMSLFSVFSRLLTFVLASPVSSSLIKSFQFFFCKSLEYLTINIFSKFSVLVLDQSCKNLEYLNTYIISKFMVSWYICSLILSKKNLPLLFSDIIPSSFYFSIFCLIFFKIFLGLFHLMLLWTHCLVAEFLFYFLCVT